MFNLPTRSPYIPTHPRYAAARHVLTSPSIATHTASHVGDDSIDWEGVLAETTTMSGGERLLVDVARRLWSGEPVQSAYEVYGRLDPVNGRRVAEALAYLGEWEGAGLATAA